MVAETVAFDTHPPGFYIVMWFVTKLFGSSLWAIRLPSVLFGAGSILLLYWLGESISRRRAGLIAAALLAFHGYHVFWSNVARMYSLACFLALLATVLTLRLARARTAAPATEILYAVATLLGVTTHVYFWTILAAQMLWVSAGAVSRGRPMPRLLRLQVLLLILGSPLLAFSAYQSGNPVAALSANAGLYARELLQFAFLLPVQGFSDAFPPDWTRAAHQLAPLTLPRAGFLLFSAVLFVIGLRQVRNSPEDPPEASGGPAAGWWLAAAAAAALVIAGHVITARIMVRPAPRPTLLYTQWMIALPFLLALGARLIRRNWDRLTRRSDLLFPYRLLTGSEALAALMAVVPFLTLAAFSMLVRPALTQRGCLILIPFVLLILAMGIDRLLAHWPAAVLLAALLVPVHVFSVRAFFNRNVDPLDHARFSQRIIEFARPDDLFFFRPWWDTTPIVYYLPVKRFHLVGRDYQESRRQYPASRVWTLLFYGSRMRHEEEMEAAVKGYRLVRTVDVPYGRALLYEPPPGE
jgi:4-amino-4-deoxy-L-arabinose transferase-like glycosyltransferase